MRALASFRRAVAPASTCWLLLSASRHSGAQDAQMSRPTDEYLAEYSRIFDHVGMLQDHERMRAYHDAIKLNAAAHFAGKVVLDIGSGTGVLAVWAAQAGAARVYAVEASGIGAHTKAMVASHGFSSVVTVLRGRMEEVELPEKVDVIVSEWMGYFLLRESFVQSVLRARDEWLKPTGVLYPSHARILIAPMAAPAFRAKRERDLESWMADWDDLASELDERYSLNLGVLRAAYEEEQQEYAFREAWQGAVPGQLVSGEPIELLSLDMHTASHSDFFGWSRTVNVPASAAEPVHALCGWFDVRFCGRDDSPADECIELSTSPLKAQTHWGQTGLLLQPPLRSPVLTVHLGQNKRSFHDLNVTLTSEGQSASYAITADFRAEPYDDDTHDGDAYGDEGGEEGADEALEESD